MNLRPVLLSFVVLFLGPGACAHKGKPAAANALQVSGRVSLAGEVPPPRRIEVPPSLKAAFPNGLEISPYRLGTEGTLGEVVVSVVNPPARRPPSSDTPRRLLISNTLCEPRVLAVYTNQPVEFEVRGGPLLNLSALARPGTGWNRAVAGPDTFVKRFDQPDSQVRITDNNHAWLSAYVSVFDHPWFAVTDETGQFSLPPLPPGRYTLQFAHRRAGVVSAEIDSASPAPLTVDVTFNPPSSNQQTQR